VALHASASRLVLPANIRGSPFLLGCNTRHRGRFRSRSVCRLRTCGHWRYSGDEISGWDTMRKTKQRRSRDQSIVAAARAMESADARAMES
jgi:hypothetical protein